MLAWGMQQGKKRHIEQPYDKKKMEITNRNLKKPYIIDELDELTAGKEEQV